MAVDETQNGLYGRFQLTSIYLSDLININYRRPAVMNDLVCVETSIDQWRNRSAVIRQDVKLKEGGELVADARVTFVIFDTRKQKTAILDGALFDMLSGVYL